MIRLRNDTEDLLPSITKNCEMLLKKTDRKAEETLDFKIRLEIKPRDTFHLNPPVEINDDWMIGLTDLEVYNSFFNITEENNEFELYKIPDEKSGGVSYEKVTDETEKDLDNSDSTATDLKMK